jgi:predicted small lipoprotein YifL
MKVPVTAAAAAAAVTGTVRGHCPPHMDTKVLELIDILPVILENLVLKGGWMVMKMKRLLLMLLMGFSLFSLAGCGNDEPPEEGEKIEDVEEEDEIGDGEVDDE